MKIFLDTANLEEIKKWGKTGLINGVTTNPSHLSKEGSDPTDVVKAICKALPKGDISVEITKSDPQEVYDQARAIAKIADNVVVKVPCHLQYFPIIKKLILDGVPLNITLVFTLLQSLMMCKLGVKYISPFVGRWDDIDAEGALVLPKIREMIDHYGYKTQLLAASIRGVRNFHYAVLSGADAVTLPIAVLQKAAAHVLTDRGIEKFDADWKKLGIKQFP